MGRPSRTPHSAITTALFLSACLAACSRGAGPSDRPASAAPGDTAQGIAGTFEALGGARLADPLCDTLTVEARRDSCERHFLSQMTWPLAGHVTIHSHLAGGGDSLTVKLDSLGGYRAPLAPGFYRVCVQAAALEGYPDSCTDSVQVKAGAYTPFSRPFPMP